LAFDKERNKTVDTPQIRPGDHRLRSGSLSAAALLFRGLPPIAPANSCAPNSNEAFKER
jgi:hypothetical protein